MRKRLKRGIRGLSRDHNRAVTRKKKKNGDDGAGTIRRRDEEEEDDEEALRLCKRMERAMEDSDADAADCDKEEEDTKQPYNNTPLSVCVL